MLILQKEGFSLAEVKRRITYPIYVLLLLLVLVLLLVLLILFSCHLSEHPSSNILLSLATVPPFPSPN